MDIRIYGCGGCGANMLALIEKMTDYPLPAGCKTVRLDTSMSNVDANVKDVQIIGSGQGSGKIRAANAEAAHSYISNMFAKEAPGDVNIIVCSSAGGSGSVIGPMLANEILVVHEKPVILVMVVDASDGMNAKNSMNTLASLDNMARSNEFYLPVMLFSNIGNVHKAVDHSVVVRINQLCVLLTHDVKELDFTDRINWLLPSKTVNAPSGVYGLSIRMHKLDGTVESLDGESAIPDKDYPFDSLLSISNAEYGNRNTGIAQVSYHGITKSSMDWSHIVGMIGHPIDPEVVSRVEAAVRRFTTTERKTGGISFKTSPTGSVSSKTHMIL